MHKHSSLKQTLFFIDELKILHVYEFVVCHFMNSGQCFVIFPNNKKRVKKYDSQQSIFDKIQSVGNVMKLCFWTVPEIIIISTYRENGKKNTQLKKNNFTTLSPY